MSMTTEHWEDWRCEVERMVRQEFPDKEIKITRKRYRIQIIGYRVVWNLTAAVAEAFNHCLIEKLHQHFDWDGPQKVGWFSGNCLTTYTSYVGHGLVRHSTRYEPLKGQPPYSPPASFFKKPPGDPL